MKIGDKVIVERIVTPCIAGKGMMGFIEYISDSADQFNYGVKFDKLNCCVFFRKEELRGIE